MDVFPRARITEKLHQSLERGGIVGVFAPSGYGKSVAVELAFSERVLVSLPDDNPQAGAIATAIVEALAPHALPSLSNFLQSPERDDSWKRLADLTAQHLRPTNRIVALDDLQHVNSPVAMRFLERLIAATRRPDNLRWVLIGRDVPALLPISDWIGRDYMSLPLDADDLAFTLEDARGVASQMNIAIDDEILGELLSDVLGWPLAFRIAVRTRLSGKPTFVRSAIASRDVIFDLLESELWRDLSGSERRLLTIATYLTDVDADLLARIGFADAPSALAALQRRTPLFVQTAGDGFSAHDLLRSFVSHRHRDDIEDLTTLLAQALALSGRSMRAADLYIRAARWDAAAAVLTAHGPAIIARGERAQLIDAIGQLPHELRERPSLTALFGWCRLDDGNIEAGLADMRRVLDHDAPNALRDAIAEKLIIFYNATGRPRDARDIATQLLSFPRNGDDNILAHAALARAEAQMGNAEGAAAQLARARELLPLQRLDRRADVWAQLAATNLYLGRSDEAQLAAQEALYLAEPLSLYATSTRAHAVLAKVAIGNNQLAVAREKTERSVRLASLSGDMMLEALALDDTQTLAAIVGDNDAWDKAQVRLDGLGVKRYFPFVGVRIFNGIMHYLGADDPDAAAAFIEQHETLPHLSSGDRDTLRAARALVLISSDGLHTRAELEAWAPEPDGDHEHSAGVYHHIMWIGAALLYAVALWMIDDPSVESFTEQVCEQTIPLKILCRFAGVVRTLIQEPRNQLTATRVAELTQPLTRAGVHGRARFLKRVFVQPTKIPLSKTELEVLVHLSRGEGAAEIAQILVKSVNTVKTQMKHINAKLGVNSRGAVAKALAEGWIDSSLQSDRPV